MVSENRTSLDVAVNDLVEQGLSVAKKSVANPAEAYTAATRLGKLVSERGLRSAYLFLHSEYLDSGRYRAYLDDEYARDIVPVETRVGEMYVDTGDRGISRQLIIGGVHERGATARFERELRRLQAQVDDVTILEIGGNIGYYTNVEAEVIDDGDIFIVEPSPKNVEILRRNLDVDTVDVDVTQGAISDSTGTAELVLSEMSNCHSMEREPGRDESRTTSEVETWTADRFLEEKGLDPAAIDVVRMDVEGHEGKIFKGMDDVLAQPGPLLLFVELHSELRDNRELDFVLETLDDHGFEFVYACNDNFIDGPTNELSSLNEVPDNLTRYSNVEVFLKKGY